MSNDTSQPNRDRTNAVGPGRAPVRSSGDLSASADKRFAHLAGITVGRGVVDAFVAAFGPYKARGEKVVCRHLGIEALDDGAGAHVAVPPFMAAMAELADQFGGAFMRKIGSFIFDNAVFPPGIDTAAKAMAVIDVAYYMNHNEAAKGRIGNYRWTAEGNGGLMYCDNPYPCPFDIGIIDTIARRFAPTATVEHLPGSCRLEGGTACTYRVRW